MSGEPTHRLEEVTPASLGPVPHASRMCSNAEIGTRPSRSLKPRRTSGAGSSSPCAVLPNRHSSGSLRVLVLAAAVSKKQYQHATHAAGQYLSFATRSGLTFSNDPAWLAPILRLEARLGVPIGRSSSAPRTGQFSSMSHSGSHGWGQRSELRGECAIPRPWIAFLRGQLVELRVGWHYHYQRSKRHSRRARGARCDGTVRDFLEIGIRISPGWS